jgi:hypothetical protein
MSTIQAFFFIDINLFYFISNNNCRLLTTVPSVRHYVWLLRSAILLALEMMNEWTPTFFLNIFYAGIVQSNLCWKIHNKYVFRVNFHIFVLKYLAQIQIIQNQFKISEGGTNVNGTATKCHVYTVHEWLKITIFVLLELK